MYHGKRWRSDPLYQALMVQTATAQVFVALSHLPTMLSRHWKGPLILHAG